MKKLTKTTGIYYLFKNNKVVYIGQSEFCERRVYAHCKDKNFGSYFIYSVDKNILSDIEAKEILLYKPKYNQSIPDNNIFYTLPKYFKNILKIKKYGYKRIENKIKNKHNIKTYRLKDKNYYLKNKLDIVYGI